MWPRPARPILGRMDKPTVTIAIELRLDGDAPAGTVRPEGGAEKGFTGWIGLVAALDEIVDDLPSAATSISRRTS